MKKNQYMAVGAIAAMTAFVPNLKAAEAEVKVEGDIDRDRPKAELQTELNKDRDADRRLSATTTAQAEADREKVMKYNKASGLLGMEVRNAQNEKLGDVKDLVFDLNTGKISYAVLAVGGFLGIGEKLLALPPSSLKVSEDMTHLTLNADKTKIEAAPGFAATSWPSVANPDIDKFWGSTSVGSPATREVDRDRSTIKSENDRDLDVDVDAKVDRDKKIYTDADKDAKVRIDVDND